MTALNVSMRVIAVLPAIYIVLMAPSEHPTSQFVRATLSPPLSPGALLLADTIHKSNAFPYADSNGPQGMYQEC